VTEALGKIDLRSISSLASQAKKLHIRLISNIKPELCWRKFVTENGSELINRSVGMFQDAVNLGGEPEEVGSRTSFFALRIALLRAKRTLISSSFRWLSFLMHAATIGLLVFVVEIMTTFGEAIESIKEALPGTSMPSSIPSLGFSFNFTGLELLQDLSVPVILVFTIVNALAPQVTDGGHKYKFFYYLGITLAISGALLIYVPKMAGMVFGVISI
jgi:flagellar protein FlaJ